MGLESTCEQSRVAQHGTSPAGGHQGIHRTTDRPSKHLYVIKGVQALPQTCLIYGGDGAVPDGPGVVGQ